MRHFIHPIIQPLCSAVSAVILTLGEGRVTNVNMGADRQRRLLATEVVAAALYATAMLLGPRDADAALATTELEGDITGETAGVFNVELVAVR